MSHCSVIQLGISDHDIVYCARKTPLLKLNKYNVRSMKNYTKEKYLELLRKTDFAAYMTFICVNKVYQDFIFELREVTDLLYPSKNLTLKANWKP